MVLDERGFEHSPIGRLADGLSTIFDQSRLRVKTFDVADAAQHEDPDDVLSLRGEMRFAIRRSPVLDGSRSRDAVALQHGAQHQPGKTKPGISQKRSAADSSTTTAEK